MEGSEQLVAQWSCECWNVFHGRNPEQNLLISRKDLVADETFVCVFFLVSLKISMCECRKLSTRGCWCSTGSSPVMLVAGNSCVDTSERPAGYANANGPKRTPGPNVGGAFWH